MSKRRKLGRVCDELIPVPGRMAEGTSGTEERSLSSHRTRDRSQDWPPDPAGSLVPFITGIAQMGAVDDALYGSGGLMSHVVRRENRESLVAGIRKAAGNGLTLRQAMLDICAREFGRPPLDLSRALPGALSPPGGPESEVLAFWLQIRHSLEEGHALIFAEPELLSVTELVVRRLQPGEDDADIPLVLVGFVPWEYALLARKTSGLRNALGLQKDEEKWSRGVAFEFLPDREEPTLRTVWRPEDPAQADEVFRWLLLEVLHPRLTVPNGAMLEDERKPVITEV